MRKISFIIGGAAVAVMFPLFTAAQTTNDTIAPSVPANIIAAVVSSSEINLSWGPSNDNVAVIGYKIFRTVGSAAFTQVATSTGASYQDTGLAPATIYVYTIAAYDAAGNVSAQSAPVPGATQSPPLGSVGGTSPPGPGGTGGIPGSSGTQTPPPDPLSGSTATPYQFQRQGIFDCNQNGAYAMSVGALGAIVSTYVPVSDAAVELNTGILVYKECVLREVVDREREAAMSAFLKKAYTGIQTGRNGNPLFVQNEGKELLTYVSDPETLAFLQDGTLLALKQNLQGPITRAIATNYRVSTRKPETILNCPYADNPPSVWDTVRSIGTSCNPIIAYYNAQELRGIRDAVARQTQLNEWIYGRGYYARTDNPLDPLARRVLSPASSIQTSFQMLVDSPVRQLESANDVGQMISALYAGVTTQIISDNQGLAGLSKSSGGQLSYLDQVAKESALGVRNAAVNAALQILNAAQQVESAYYQTVNGIASILTNAINQLRSAERQCWNLIIPKVCVTPLAGDNTCFAPGPCTTDDNGTTTCVPGPKLKIATSTAFSQNVIGPQITPLANTTLASIDKSQKALQSLSNLVAGLTNTASLDAQRLALQQLDSLVHQRALHNQQDLQTVRQQRDAVDASMSTLVQNTVKAWADSTDPSVGWCNVNNQAAVDTWIQRWKQ